MAPLTERQRKVLEFIVQYIQENRYPPTVREIGVAMGIRSTNGVSDHLKALERKAYLERQGMKSRALVPTAGAWKLLGVSREEGGPEPLEAAASADAQTVRIPLLGRVAAGQPILAEESWEDSVQIDRALLGRRPEQSTFALKVKGDSMIGDGIHEGDLVVVRQQPTARPGEIVVARIENEATVKRFHPEGDRIRLQPSNPTLEPIYVERDAGRDVQILGVVIGLFRSFPQ